MSAVSDAVRAVVPDSVRAAPVSGGCINDAWRVEVADGSVLFVKTAPSAPVGMYEAEADGLRWLAEAGAPVPAVRAVVDGPGSAQRGIALEWLEAASPEPDRDAVLGRRLAALHRTGAPEFGRQRPGFIGTVPQDNTPAPSWPEFYAERRLRPAARHAHDLDALDAAGLRLVDRVCDRLPQLSGPDEPPARLHGDLWGGNAILGPDGHTWLIDPAAYGGHREVDLAMMVLFGGFSSAVFAAYREVHPLSDGHRQRAGLWQLWPLLVHAILFGAGYGHRAAETARQYL